MEGVRQDAGYADAVRRVRLDGDLTVEVNGEEWEASRLVVRNAAGDVVREIPVPDARRRPPGCEDASAHFVEVSEDPFVRVFFYPNAEYQCRLLPDGSPACDWTEFR